MSEAHQSDTPAVGYRPCVGIFLLDPEQRRVFVGQRADTAGTAWQMPQGGIDAGEDPVDAARREMREEIGTDSATFLAASKVWRSYSLPPDLARRMWGGRYRGQTQLWMAFRFDGSDQDIMLDGEHPEFRAWQWIEPIWLPQVIVPFKRDVYMSVVDEFRNLWS
jgi:putative (di)nucleoside polyphosphate hydrolase